MIQAFLELVKSKYSEDIGLVIAYGSSVTNTMHEKSDIDLVFIVKNDRGWECSRGFIFNDIGYDFFGMTVERLHGIINEFQPLISIVASGVLLWADSDEKVGHFKALQDRLNHLSETTSPMTYQTHIESVLDKMKVLVFDYSKADEAQQWHLQGQLLYHIMHYLQLINRNHYHYGMKRMKEESLAMALKPDNLEKIIDNLTLTLVGSETLHEYVTLLSDHFTSLQDQKVTSIKEFDGFYEEELSMWNKLYHSASKNDHVTTFMAATSLENELSYYRHQGWAITPLFESYRGNLLTLVTNAQKTQQQVLTIFDEQCHHPTKFESIEDVVAYIKG